MIKKPEELVNEKPKFSMIIAGYPGIGKTTLALSAPNPILLDLDKGVFRVKAQHRTITDEVDTYEELLADLTPENLLNIETVIIDTGGRLLDLMKGWAGRKSEKNMQTDGNLTLKGYGVVGAEFMRFVNMIKYDLKKNVIITFHAKEEKDGENTRLRILVEGQTKDNVWQPIDIGGFMEIKGNDRTISFTNCERYFAKGNFGIEGTYKIPILTDTTKNDFVTKLFEQMEAYIDKDNQIYAQTRADYDNLIAKFDDLIGNMTPETIKQIQTEIEKAQNVFTSEKEIKTKFMQKLTEIGYKWDNTKKSYVPIKKE